MLGREMGDILRGIQETRRYPSKYSSFREFLQSDGFFKPTFRPIKDHSLIIKHYDEIIELINNDKYYEAYYLITTKNDCEANMPLIKTLVLTSLLEYCIDSNDNKMLMILIDMDTFENAHCIHTLSNVIIRHDKFDIFKMIMDNVNFENDNMKIITSSIIYYRKENAILYFKVIMEKGFQFNESYIQEAIIVDNHQLIQHFINEGFDIQTSFNSLETHSYNLTINTLKVLHNCVDISKHIINIYDIALFVGKLDTVIYILDHFPELDLGRGMKKAFDNGHIEIMKYLLVKGANITDIEPITNISTINIETFKFLVHCGYPVDTLEYSELLLKYFVNNDIKDVTYILEYDTDHYKHIEHIINKKTKISSMEKTTLLFSCDNNNWPQPLEYIVSKGKIDHIKFLMDNYYDLIQPKINDMFVMACANGQMDCAKYLLGFDVEIGDKCLDCACFFGQLDIVKMLLELGEVFDDADFEIVVMGHYLRSKSSDIYDMLVNDDDIFKNDVYNYGSDHYKIIELLMTYDVLVGKCEFMPLIKDDFGTMEFYKYIVGHVDDVNEKFGGMYLLDTTIINKNYDVMEMLLGNGLNAFDESHVKDDVKCKSILAKYGLWDDDDICL